MRPIEAFTGPYSFLSNFYLCSVEISELIFPSAEHAYQALKTFSRQERVAILSCETPGKAKRMGRKVMLRPDWDNQRLRVMERVVEAKFVQSPRLAQLLIDTGDRDLIEGNWWGDVYWGMCKGKGENHLGKILMKVREDLQS